MRKMTARMMDKLLPVYPFELYPWSHEPARQPGRDAAGATGRVFCARNDVQPLEDTQIG
jgi:hypothetical protein